MVEIGLVYLARARSGMQPFQRFLRAYRDCPGGVAHDLLVVFKGYSDEQQVAPCRQLLQGLDHRELVISDWGFDVRAYALAARQLERRYLCFLNTFSVPLDGEWLAKLHARACCEGVGLVGATGSYESMYSNVLRDQESARGVGALAWQWVRLYLNRLSFAPFPNVHLRTNAFLISRSLLLELWPAFALTKRGAYLVENGRNSLTEKVVRRGLKAQIVGRDGRGYDPQDWPASRTFRQGTQENLLVADKQTEQYALAESETRKRLSRLAWGEQANP